MAPTDSKNTAILLKFGESTNGFVESRIGGNVAAANLIDKVEPVYPPLAKQARIQGVVVLEVKVNREGKVENLKVVTGHPLLIQAAIDAVKQWTYKPIMLNGQAVDFVTTITVNFALPAQ